MSTKRRGPGLKNKKAIWCFDSRGEPTMKKVGKLIANFSDRRFESYSKKPDINIGMCNRSQFTTCGLDEGLTDVVMLNPLDFYKILRWIRRGSMDFKKFTGQKIVFYNFPVKTSLGTSMGDPGKFYICLEENPSVKDVWIFTIRAEIFLRAQGYRIACLPRRQ